MEGSVQKLFKLFKVFSFLVVASFCEFPAKRPIMVELLGTWSVAS